MSEVREWGIVILKIAFLVFLAIGTAEIISFIRPYLLPQNDIAYWKTACISVLYCFYKVFLFPQFRRN